MGQDEKETYSGWDQGSTARSVWNKKYRFSSDVRNFERTGSSSW